MRMETFTERLLRAGQPQLFGWGFVLLRIALGLLYLNAGVTKFGGDWSAEGFLQHASGPLSTWFVSLAGNPVVDAMNAWGLTFLGLALIFGFAVRPAAIAGIVLMVLYYLADFTGNTAHGYIDEHIIYALVLALFATGGAGHIFGLNGLALASLRRPHGIVKFLLG